MTMLKLGPSGLDERDVVRIINESRGPGETYMEAVTRIWNAQQLTPEKIWNTGLEVQPPGGQQNPHQGVPGLQTYPNQQQSNQQINQQIARQWMPGAGGAPQANAQQPSTIFDNFQRQWQMPYSGQQGQQNVNALSYLGAGQGYGGQGNNALSGVMRGNANQMLGQNSLRNITPNQYAQYGR